MKTTLFIAAAAAAITFVPVSAQEAEPEEAPAQQEEGAEEEAAAEEKICRRIREEATGTRTRSRKVCATRAQWEQYDRQQR